MSFENHGTRAFTAVSIRKNAPAASGVYGLSNAREWIFIGETDDLRGRLLEHLLETNTLLSVRMPTGFTFEICGPESRGTRRGRLARELRPVCNRNGTAEVSSPHISNEGNLHDWNNNDFR